VDQFVDESAHQASTLIMDRPRSLRDLAVDDDNEQLRRILARENNGGYVPVAAFNSSI
jgi:FXSXX-COOH protein